MISPLMKKVIMGSLTKDFEEKGVTKATLTPVLTSDARELHEKSYRYRGATSIFYDYGWWFGIDDSVTREPLERMNPSLREVIDYYNTPRLTSLGQYPFTTLFLECEWRKYGLNSSIAKALESDVRRYNGVFSHAMIIDTINMVMTGERDIPLSLLVSYMDNGLTDASTLVTERFCRKEVSKLTQAEFLTKWLHTKKGMYDCIDLHRLVFNIES